MLPLEQLRARVLVGAAYLDDYDPGWALRILKPINIASTHDCILAQLYGRYRAGVLHHKLTDRLALLFGFRLDSSEIGTSPKVFKQLSEQLDALWTAEVAKRCAQ